MGASYRGGSRYFDLWSSCDGVISQSPAGGNISTLSQQYQSSSTQLLDHNIEEYRSTNINHDFGDIRLGTTTKTAAEEIDPIDRRINHNMMINIGRENLVYAKDELKSLP